jgi:hypothetical protein
MKAASFQLSRCLLAGAVTLALLEARMNGAAALLLLRLAEWIIRPGE